MNGTSLGFRLNISTGADGVGFVNPKPLPDFLSSLARLHLTRRSPLFANWNRVTQEVGELDDAGAQWQSDRAYSATGAESIAVKTSSLDYENGFTIALAVQAPSFSGGPMRLACVSSDFQNEFLPNGPDDGRGFAIAFESSLSGDFGLSSILYTADGRAHANQPGRVRPSNNAPFWVFAVWNGEELTIRSPAISADATSDMDTDVSGVEPVPNSGLFFGRDHQGRPRDDYETDIGIWAFAQWSRGLSASEVFDEYNRLIEWGDRLGVKIL